MAAPVKVELSPQDTRPKHEWLADALDNEFRSLEPGTPIPAVTALMERYSMSQGTVTHALRHLRTRGLIVRPSGRKRLVTVHQRRMQDAVLNVLFLRPQWSSPDYDMIGYALLEEASRQRLHMEVIHYGGVWNEQIASAVKSHDALIVLPAATDSPESMPWLQDVRIPTVLLWNDTDVPGVMTVADNDFTVGLQATQHLLKLGHRRVAALLSEPPSPIMQRRIEGWKQAMNAVKGFNAEELLIDCSVQPGKDAIVGSYEKLRRWLFQRDNRFPGTGAFCLCWTGALGLLRALREVGLEVPRDVSIITDAGQNRLCEFTNPALTVIQTDAADYAHTALGLIKDACLGNAPVDPHLFISPRIIERESTRTIKHV